MVSGCACTCDTDTDTARYVLKSACCADAAGEELALAVESRSSCSDRDACRTAWVICFPVPACEHTGALIKH